MAEPSAAREELFGKIRSALGGRPPRGSEPEVTDDLLRRVSAENPSAVADRFAAEATAAGAAISRCDRADLATVLADLLRQVPARSLSVGELGAFDAPVRDAMERAGCQAVDWRAHADLEGHFAADCGLGLADAAIAESGTLALHSGTDQGRGLFLVPPAHLALVPESRVQADLVDYLKEDPRTASRVLVTGPSKTADIEGVLITGVHGPERLLILLIAGA